MVVFRCFNVLFYLRVVKVVQFVQVMQVVQVVQVVCERVVVVVNMGKYQTFPSTTKFEKRIQIFNDKTVLKIK